MTNTLENLRTCIEKYAINNGEPFYCDMRFGTVIDVNKMHNYYKSNVTKFVQDIKRITDIDCSMDLFICSIIDLAGDSHTISVRYYNIDNSFVLHSYNPLKIIPAILKAFPHMFKNHPFYDYNYIPDYTKAPNTMLIQYESDSPRNIIYDEPVYDEDKSSLKNSPSSSPKSCGSSEGNESASDQYDSINSRESSIDSNHVKTPTNEIGEEYRQHLKAEINVEKNIGKNNSVESRIRRIQERYHKGSPFVRRITLHEPSEDDDNENEENDDDNNDDDNDDNMPNHSHLLEHSRRENIQNLIREYRRCMMQEHLMNKEFQKLFDNIEPINLKPVPMVSREDNLQF